jgi:hypothetical protein
MADEPPSSRNGKLKIPLPFDDALKAAMKVPADKLAKPNGKKPRAAKTQPKP